MTFSKLYMLCHMNSPLVLIIIVHTFGLFILPESIRSFPYIIGLRRTANRSVFCGLCSVFFEMFDVLFIDFNIYLDSILAFSNLSFLYIRAIRMSSIAYESRSQ